MATANPQRGYVLGLTAYIIWGLFPLYFKALQSVPAMEIIVHRVLWSALFGGLLLLVWKHPGWWRELRDNPKRLAVLAGCGLLIATNWLVYVWAVNNGRMIEASLGYYINPLINVLLGLLILGERLRRLQWLAVALAALGVLQQLWQVGNLPWVSLVLALTFGFYGLIRKQAPVAALPGLVVETWLLVPVALAWFALHPAAKHCGWQPPGRSPWCRWCASTPRRGICPTPRWASCNTWLRPWYCCRPSCCSMSISRRAPCWRSPASGPGFLYTAWISG